MMHLYYLKIHYPTLSCYPKILPIHSLSLSIRCVFTGKKMLGNVDLLQL